MATTALYWLTHDLRLCDNPALRAAAASADQMLLVYCVDPSWFQPGQFQSRPMGQHRWRFIYQSLRELDHQLSALGQRLLIRFDDPETTIDQLIRKYRVDTLVRSHAVATDEQQQLEQIRERHPRLHIAQFWTHTLFSPDHLPFDLQHLPTTFTQFRKAVESLHISTPLAAPGCKPSSRPGHMMAAQKNCLSVYTTRNCEHALNMRSITVQRVGKICTGQRAVPKVFC